MSIVTELSEELYTARIDNRALEAKVETMREALKEAYVVLRMAHCPALLKRIKATLAAKEGE